MILAVTPIAVLLCTHNKNVKVPKGTANFNLLRRKDPLEYDEGHSTYNNA